MTLLGTRAHKVRLPDIQGPGATLVKSEALPSETLILIDLPKASMSDKPLAEEFASVGAATKDILVTLLSPDSAPHVDIPAQDVSDDQDSEVAIDSGDPAARAGMFGRYAGQIDARIERAWRRPRSPINPDTNKLRDSDLRNLGDATADQSFKCQVQIIQDRRGSVQEVQMLNCNGSVVWQQSLVAAILAASPLPAPPNPNVFTHALTMTFTAAQYGRGSPADDYELEATAPVRVANGK
jgi:hypothetical protein